jgi:hypothetical protein
MDKIKRTLLLPILLLLITACLPVEEPVLPPPILATVESASYRTATVYQGDVVSFRDINAVLYPAREELLAFAMNDAIITNIYIEVGDEVVEGEIVAELERAYFIRELERTHRDISPVHAGFKATGRTVRLRFVAGGHHRRPVGRFIVLGTAGKPFNPA